ncbi:tyrosine-type recombinase/integrase [Haemophilus parahaemolyticus]|uniref:tyrosine-type recombinase/integrase n=1 Tax=Haemophilus parahaemolyticus TaxID=735 RepID=UPI0028ED6890|nr:tyrosine-type recombinase/integrase [Haemophilus parahaemolyticus]
MARPRKRQNQGLPPNLLCRRRKRASGQIVEYFYYVLANGKEKSLGSDKYHAVLEAAKLNMASHQVSEIVLFIDVAKRYELEVVPTKSKSTQLSNHTAIKWLCRFFGNPPVALEKIEPKHISQYLQWRKNNPPSANNEIGLLSHIWNKAREWGYTKLPSPSQGVKKYPVKFRDVYIEDYLLEKLIECADGQMQDILQIMYLIGQRPIDICKIHRSHIYNGVLHITQKKTKKKIQFALVGKLKEIIERRLQNGNEWLFTNKRGRQLKRERLSDFFDQLKRKTIANYPALEDELLPLQLRDLRAKSATDLSLLASDEQAQKTLGHTTPKMTQHYIRKEKTLKPLDEIISIKIE